MLFNFFFAMREAGLKVGLSELLVLQEGLAKHLALFSLEEFYHLSRTTMVKDETQYDRFDRAFGAYFKGVEAASKDLFGEIPDEWLRKQAERLFTDEEKEKILALGGLDKLMEELKKRLEEQKGRHQGGNKWVGTGGTSPFGNSGYNPEGIRIGGEGGQQQRSQSLGSARIPQPRRLDRAGHPQHQAGAAAPAKLRARGRGRYSRPRRHHHARPRATPAGSTSRWCRSGTTR